MARDSGGASLVYGEACWRVDGVGVCLKRRVHGGGARRSKGEGAAARDAGIGDGRGFL